MIGAGPAGLMAAEMLARAGRSVVWRRRKPTVGRKFLMAGKSGLNLTKDEPPEPFSATYGSAAERLRPMVEAFGADAMPRLGRGLGQEVFTGQFRPGLSRGDEGLAASAGMAWTARRGDGVAFGPAGAGPGGRTGSFAFDDP